jgi:AI-2 transport protein TqsA
MDSEKLTLAIQKQIPKIATNSFGTVLSFFSSTIFVCIFILFLLIGYKPQNQPKGIYADIIHKIRRYITTKTVVSIITGLLVWLTLSAFGLQLAPVFGVMAFLLNFIPSIGSIIATLLPLPIAFAQFQNPWLITFVILIPGAIQITIGNIIEPKLMGKELSLHPAAILLALSFWGLFWGIIGMFLAVPITAIIRIILMQFESLKPIGNLLAGKLPQIKSTPEAT